MPELSFVPGQPFVAENKQTIDDIFTRLEQDFPGSGMPAERFLDDDHPTPAMMGWMWQRLMGRQHGNMEADEGKLVLSARQADRYWPYITQLHYGDYGFTEPHLADRQAKYTKGFVLGGTPDGMAVLLQNTARNNVDDIVLMAGQRTRWDIPSEASTQAIYSNLFRETGVNMDRLRLQSPFLRSEERRDTGDIWHRPFATEYEIGRAAVEAVFYDHIDWNDYRVEFIPANDSAESFRFGSQPYDVPDREVALATYHLRDGNRVHVLNGRAVNRALGVPRPNSTSQTSEIMELLPPQEAERALISSSVPHVRAGLDISTRLVADHADNLEDITLSTARWLPHSNAVTALGEIAATHKADMRLRAALRGEDPDQPALAGL